MMNYINKLNDMDFDYVKVSLFIIFLGGLDQVSVKRYMGLRYQKRQAQVLKTVVCFEVVATAAIYICQYCDYNKTIVICLKFV